MRSLIDPTIFKSYDVCGVYPSQLNEDVAYGIGRCFVPLIGSKRVTVAVGRDMRPSGRGLADAFASGVCDAGLRLNVEGDTLESMERHRDEALAVIRDREGSAGAF